MQIYTGFIGAKCSLAATSILSSTWACIRRDLEALFRDLVQESGSISEQEFWVGRQHLLRKQQGSNATQKQRAGVGNAMILATRPSADGKTNTVCFAVPGGCLLYPYQHAMSICQKTVASTSLYFRAYSAAGMSITYLRHLVVISVLTCPYMHAVCTCQHTSTDFDQEAT